MFWQNEAKIINVSNKPNVAVLQIQAELRIRMDEAGCDQWNRSCTDVSSWVGH